MLSPLLTVAGIHLVAVLSPGPDIAVVLRQSFRHGRTAGYLVAAGIGTGNLLHLFLATAGFALVLKNNPAIYTAATYLAAAYLVYIAARCLFSKPPGDTRPDSTGAGTPGRSSFLLGLVTTVLNPKATLFYLSVFTVVLDPDTTPALLLLTLGIYLPVASAAVFAAVARLASTARFRHHYATHGHWIDRLMAVALLALAIKLVSSTLTP
ncbi:MAG: LysE family translocator [Verrucomicrobiales bacterium]|nr:LysE family translocator [Verrucomicrobiales bacterium]